MEQWVALLPHSKRVLGSRAFLCEYSPSVCMGSLHILCFLLIVQTHAVSRVGLTGESKLDTGVNVSDCGSLCFTPATGLSRVYPASRCMVG